MQGLTLPEYFDANCPELLNKGEIVTVDGEKKGVHDGIQNYTVGQRRGLGIPDATPYYVVGLDAKNSQVIIGKEADLWRDWLVVRDMNWLAGREPELPGEYSVKVRYHHQGSAAVVTKEGDGYKISFTQSQRAITPGQFAVLYRGDEVVGGGEIC